MLVADAQIHVWAPSTPERPWIPNGQQYAHGGRPSFAPSHVIGEMDEAGVDRALLVSPTWEGPRNDLVLDAAQSFPDRFRAIVRFPLDQPDEVGLERLAVSPYVVGARAAFVRESEPWLREGVVDWLWPVLEDLKLPVMIFAPQQQDAVASVAERYPNLRIALCHLGLHANTRSEDIGPELHRTRRLADHPNIAVKASSLASYGDEAYPYPGIHPHLKQVIHAFGPDRVFWGSDLSRLPCTYRDLVALFTKELNFLEGEALDLVMGTALMRWSGWDVPSGTT